MANTAIIIIGQCRSGTSLCAGILHQLGCDMGGTGQVGPYNPKGNFTDATFDYLIRCIQADSTDSVSKVKLAAYLKNRDKLTAWGVKHWLMAGPLITWMTTNLTSQIKVVYTARDLMGSANSLNALRGGNGVANANDIAFINAQQTWIANAQQPGGALYGLPSMAISYPNIFAGMGSGSGSGSASGSIGSPGSFGSGSMPSPVGPLQLVADLAAFAGLPNNPALAQWVDPSLYQSSVVQAQLTMARQAVAPFPRTLRLGFAGLEGDCAALRGRKYELAYEDARAIWVAVESGSGFLLSHDQGVWNLSMGDRSAIASSFTPRPFIAMFPAGTFANGCSGQAIVTA